MCLVNKFNSWCPWGCKEQEPERVTARPAEKVEATRVRRAAENKRREDERKGLQDLQRTHIAKASSIVNLVVPSVLFSDLCLMSLNLLPRTR
mmetsp:Transcript_11005/g.18023  ORF Transcript_11005/g.18023 Transcript_11005/m.18023 type:complete len:92 (-) Transcript_11005:703-978(-)